MDRPVGVGTGQALSIKVLVTSGNGVVVVVILLGGLQPPNDVTITKITVASIAEFHDVGCLRLSLDASLARSLSFASGWPEAGKVLLRVLSFGKRC